MQTDTIIREGDVALSVSLLPSGTRDEHLSLEIANHPDHDESHVVTITVLTRDKLGFLELLKKVTDECILRVRDEEQKGERDDA